MSGRSKNWALTINNWTDADKQRLLGLHPDVASYVVVGIETGESGTPHIQGFVSFKTVTRFNAAKALIGQTAHIEVARQPKNAAEYCKKDGIFEERGAMATTQGQRGDLEDFKAAVKGGTLSLKQLREEHSEVMAKYANFCQQYVVDHTPLKEVAMHALRDWQQELYAKLRLEADDRKIIFIVDLQGNKGKSWFSRYFQYLHPDETQIIQPGKRDNMAYVLDTTTRVLFMDAPRSKQGDYIQYDFLEQIKDGMVSSYKYTCINKCFPHKVHVVVNMNQEPDMEKLSEDRYDIMHV